MIFRRQDTVSPSIKVWQRILRDVVSYSVRTSIARCSIPSVFNRLARLKTPANPCAGGGADVNTLNRRFPKREYPARHTLNPRL
jgi:hypothetical protein